MNINGSLHLSYIQHSSFGFEKASSFLLRGSKVELNDALGLVIKELRQQRELPQEGLGPSQSYISAIERGKWKPSLEKIEQIAAILSVHPASLLILAYLRQAPAGQADQILNCIQAEIEELRLPGSDSVALPSQ
ncbi:helix-turn-helix domain-containing protein [Stutzerimonas nitrititolerans]|uniref:helix-turn-helix domain-containing protein n=1 Tax=Stutzerimonas nitrititolerans TaxID=2482751 RepID=UPI00289D8E09|nr:helix-turn-helix transcriptional regulator [Stutzerimonas nitrititolerans]